MFINNDIKLDYDDVLICPHKNFFGSRKEVEIERDFQFFHSPKTWQGCPIIASNMDTTGTFAMGLSLAKHKMITCLHKFYNPQQIKEFFEENPIQYYVWVSTGIIDTDLDRLKVILRETKGINICVDVANGHSDFFIKKVKCIRDLSPDSIIMAGNICTQDLTSDIIQYGKADIVKVGIGPGSFCITRQVTGVGYPQLSAVMECSNIAHGLVSAPKRLGLVCGDGGVKCVGDICKAFGANSDFVMLGSLLMGYEQNCGEWKYKFSEHTNKDEKAALKCYGMSSYEAQSKYGGIREHVASEGDCKWVDYKGDIEVILKEIKGGLRSCGSYINANSIKDFGKCTSFIRVNRIK